MRYHKYYPALSEIYQGHESQVTVQFQLYRSLTTGFASTVNPQGFFVAIIYIILIGLYIHLGLPLISKAKLSEAIILIRPIMIELATQHAVNGSWPENTDFSVNKGKFVNVDEIHTSHGNFDLILHFSEDYFPELADKPYNLSFRLGKVKETATLFWLCDYYTNINAKQITVNNSANIPKDYLPSPCD